MNTRELLALRLHNQMLEGDNTFKKAEQVVSWMGAMQSQALEMAKWAIGVRLPGSAVNDVEQALNEGRVIRTHILRPTWHFVAAEDIHWMLDLSIPRLRPAYASYRRQRGVSDEFLLRTNAIIEKSFDGDVHLTTQEIQTMLGRNGITNDRDILSIIIGSAELEGILCNGKLRGNKQTYTLLQQWAPKKQQISKEEALERLARRYFTSHGPATIEDFAWWSGLTLTDCKRALGLIGDDFMSENVNGRTFWFRNDLRIPPDTGTSVLLLSQFDEFVVSYKNRSEIVEDIHYGKVMTRNGLFDPTMMLGGEIIGKWKKNTVKKAPKADLTYFLKTTKKAQALFDRQARRVEAFYKKDRV